MHYCKFLFFVIPCKQLYEYPPVENVAAVMSKETNKNNEWRTKINFLLSVMDEVLEH